MTKTTPQPTQIPALSYDVIVLGSGAAGLAAAVTASSRGLKVLLVEKAAAFGGTSAISGGAVWLHDTDQARAAGHHLPQQNRCAITSNR
nr:FAD-dependent oxidoreductase [Pseudomonas versuta]